MSWLGVLGSGLATAAGVMSDNEYLVAGGAGAAQSYANDYEKLTTSLIDEQKQIRLADALMARQKNYQIWDRQFRDPDIQYERGQQEKITEGALSAQQAQIRASDSTIELNKGKLALDERQMGLAEQNAKRQNALFGLQMQEAQLSLSEKKKMQDPEYRKQRALEEAQIQGAVLKEVSSIQRANNAEELKAQIAQVEELYGKGTPAAQQMAAMLQLKSIGVDVGMFSKKGAQPPTPEVVEKVWSNARELALTRKDIADKIKSNDPRLAAQGQAMADMEANAAVDVFSETFARTQGTTGGFSLPMPGVAGGQQQKAEPRDLFNGLISGEITPATLLQNAKTPEQTAKAKAAIAEFNKATGGSGKANTVVPPSGEAVASEDAVIGAQGQYAPEAPAARTGAYNPRPDAGAVDGNVTSALQGPQAQPQVAAGPDPNALYEAVKPHLKKFHYAQLNKMKSQEERVNYLMDIARRERVKIR